MTGWNTWDDVARSVDRSIWLLPAAPPRRSAEERAAALLRDWLTPEQVGQLDRLGAFAIHAPRPPAYGLLLALVPGTSMIYDPRNAVAYGWVPENRASLPDADVMLSQALALAHPGNVERMLQSACRWPRGQHAQREVASGGPAWQAVDRLAAELGA